MSKWAIAAILGSTFRLACGGGTPTPEAPEAPAAEAPKAPETPATTETPAAPEEKKGGDTAADRAPAEPKE